MKKWLNLNIYILWYINEKCEKYKIKIRKNEGVYLYNYSAASCLKVPTLVLNWCLVTVLLPVDIYTHKKVTSVFNGSASLYPMMLSPQKLNLYFSWTLDTKSWKLFEFIFNSQRIMELNAKTVFHYCNEVNCQIVAFVMLHDSHECQKTKKDHLNTKQLIKWTQH